MHNDSINFRILGRDCNTELFQHHYFSGSHDDMVVSQSKDAIIYVTVSITRGDLLFEINSATLVSN